MRTPKSFWIAILVLLGAIIGTQVAHAATATLRVGSIQAPSGSAVEVPIEALGAPGIGPLQMELVYDPAVLTAESVTRGALLSGNVLMESNVTPRGRVIIALVAADPLKGDGVIVKVRFKVIGGPGQQGVLTLENVKAWERSNQREVLVNTEAGKVTVAGAATDSSLWFLLCAASLCGFLLLAVAGILLWRRRRRSGPMPPASPSAARMTQPRPSELPEQNERLCINCAHAIRPGAKFCDHCGKQLSG